MVPDLGFLASTDPVAIDAASYDLVNAAPSVIHLGENALHTHGYDKFTAHRPQTQGRHQIDYAEQIGMGTTNYELVKV